MDLLKYLSRQEADLVLELVRALGHQAKSSVNPESDFCDEDFSAQFVSRLKIYHALNDDVLKKKTFEYAFARSLIGCGKVAIVTENTVLAGADVVVDGVRFSLKTEASKTISLRTITISKLMEARWIRECTDAQSISNYVRGNIIPHLERYDRILLLRAFKRVDSYRYRLIEIPLSLLLKVGDLDSSSFSPRTKNGSSRASVYLGDTLAFNLSLDGSVEKVTISGLVESLCFLHGEWDVPVGGVLESCS